MGVEKLNADCIFSNKQLCLTYISWYIGIRAATKWTTSTSGLVKELLNTDGQRI